MIATESSEMSLSLYCTFALGSHFGTKEAFDKMNPPQQMKIEHSWLSRSECLPHSWNSIEVTKSDTYVLDFLSDL